MRDIIENTYNLRNMEYFLPQIILNLT